MSALETTQLFMPTFRFTSERDIDILITEELLASRGFLELFITAATKKFSAKDIAMWEVKHSTSRLLSRREIDIRISVTLKNGKNACVLVENKLDVYEQPEQAESYQAECRELTKSKSFDLAVCGLICPRNYSEKYGVFAKKFDFVLSYEQLCDNLSQRIENELDLDEEIVARLRHRAQLIIQAIDKQRRGYVQVVLPEKAGFNAKYTALVRDIAPECLPGPQMLREDGSPAESVSILFGARGTFAELAVEIRPRRFAHEFGRGQTHRANYVAVTFPRWGKYLKALNNEFTADLQNTSYRLSANVTSSRPNPGLVLYQATAPISYDLGFDAQFEKIKTGIQQADSLRSWVLSHPEVFSRWEKLIKRLEKK